MPVLVDEGGELVEIGEGRGDLRQTSQPFSSWDGGPFYMGRPISYANIFATQLWVGTAVMRLLTWSTRVPLKVYRRLGDDGERVRLRPNEHPLARGIASPWDQGTMAELVMGLLGGLCIQGNALTDIDEGARGRIRFDPIDWRTVTPIRLDATDPNGEIVGWKVSDPVSGPAPRSAETVMHLKWWSPLGNIGISPLQQLRATITSESAAVAWAINNLKQSARPPGVIELTDDAMALAESDRQRYYDQTVEDMRRNLGGEANAGKLPVMPPGMKWTTATYTTAVEAELMAQRTLNRNEVAAIYMVPPPMIGILENATFSNIETQRAMAYTDGLAPPLVLAEQKINAHIVEGLLREDDVFVEFDFAGILRGDRLKEIQALREATGSGLMTFNEGRDVINLPRSKSPQADKLHIPGNNLKPIDEDAGVAEKSSALQRLVGPVNAKIVDVDEARDIAGIDGDAPAGSETDPAGTGQNAGAETPQQTEVHS